MISSERPGVVARWAVARVRPGHPTEFQLLSADWVRLVTHFFRLTFLCAEGEKCDVCQFLPARPFWYLPAYEARSQRACLLELSASACADLEQSAKFAGFGIRPGVKAILSRRTAKAPIKAEIVGQVPNPPAAALYQWVTPLMAIYRMPHMRPGESLADYGGRIHRMVCSRCELAAAQIRAAASARS